MCYYENARENTAVLSYKYAVCVNSADRSFSKCFFKPDLLTGRRGEQQFPSEYAERMDL
jgi:hypothetical protein